MLIFVETKVRLKTFEKNINKDIDTSWSEVVQYRPMVWSSAAPLV